MEILDSEYKEKASRGNVFSPKENHVTKISESRKSDTINSPTESKSKRMLMITPYRNAPTDLPRNNRNIILDAV